MSYQKFCIVTSGRTGSNYLSLSLHTHPNVLSWGEILNRKSQSLMDYLYRESKFLKVGEDPIKFLERDVYGEQPTDVHAVGIKLLYNHARQEEGWFCIWEYVRDNTRIIHLKRRNLFDAMLSYRLAQREGIYNIRTPNQTYNEDPIYLDSELVEKSLRWGLHEIKRNDQFFKGADVLEVFYDELVDGDRKMNQILDFIGVARVPLVSPTYRQRALPKTVMVENYNDLKSHFANTQFSIYFDE